MLIFRYLVNILQKPFQNTGLNDCFYVESGNKAANVFSLIIFGFYFGYGSKYTII